MTEDILLVNPPQFTPDIPLCAFPILKSSLTHKGISSKVLDLNVKYYHYVLSPTNQGDAWRNKSKLEQSVEEAKRNLTTLLPFSQLGKYPVARAIIDQVLNAYASRYEGALALISSSLAYPNYDSLQVFDALKDKKRNPYIKFFEHNLEKILVHPIVGLGILIPEQIIPAMTLANMIKERSPNTKVVLGGNTFTRVIEGFEQSRLRELYDFGLSSEADDSLPNLVKAIASGKKVDEEMIRSFETTIPNVQKLPMPNWDDVDFSTYFSPMPVASMLGGRGCTYNKCTFCAIPRAWKDEGRYRKRDINDAFEEMHKLYDRRGVRHIKFVEEALSLKFGLQLSDRVVQTGIPFRFESFANMERALGHQARKLAEGGWKKLMYGLETVSNDIATTVEKRTPFVASNRDELLRSTDEAGIIAFTFLMSGIPAESESSCMKTAQYVASNGNIRDFVVSPYSLDHLSKDAQHEGSELTNSLLENVKRKGDLSCHYSFTIKGRNENPADTSRRIASNMLNYIHKTRPDLAFMSSFLPAARFIYADVYGHDFAKKFVDSYELPNLSIATSAYEIARIRRTKA